MLLALLLSLTTSGPTVDPALTHPSRLRVLVTVDLRTGNTGVRVADIMSDVLAIWKPYVDLDIAGDATAADANYDDRVRVVIVDHSKPGNSPDSSSLGWIDFKAPGKPQSLVTVSTAVVMKLLADGEWGGRPIRELPPSVRARFVTQALARGISHELGHYLLRSPAHTPDGLMRPRLSAFDMMVPGTNSFHLLPAQITLLQRRAADGVLAEAPSLAAGKPTARTRPARDHAS